MCLHRRPHLKALLTRLLSATQPASYVVVTRPLAASYALDGMLLLLQKDPALEPTPIASLLLSAATPSFLRDGSTRSTRLRAHVVPPPLIRALLSVVVPSRAPWDDATRVAALRVLDAAIGSVDGVLR